jgi:hypothetical protein
MIGLIAIIVFGVLLILACWAFIWTYKAKRRKGKSDAVAFGWAIAAVVALSLPITWDAIPSWIAFEYYAHKEAGLTVFKTLDQWKAENPGVAETLEPYKLTVNDKRGASFEIGNAFSRVRLNERFSYDSKSKHLFLSVALTEHRIVDTKTGDSVLRLVAVASGNSGGFARGGAGWWAPWLIHRSSASTEVDEFYKALHAFQYLGEK